MESLDTKLYNKLRGEFDAFIEELQTAPPAKILDSAYEKVFKEDILCCFMGDGTLSDEQATAMLALDRPLDAFYRNWLDTDVSYLDDLLVTIVSCAEREATLQRESQPFEQKKEALIARLNTNHESYKASLQRYSKAELIDMATTITAMSDTHYYLTEYYFFNESDVDYLLKFQNPLEVVSDAWEQRLDDISDMGFALNSVFNNKDALETEYALAEVRAPEAPTKKPSLASQLAQATAEAKAYNSAHSNPKTNKKELETL